MRYLLLIALAACSAEAEEPDRGVNIVCDGPDGGEVVWHVLPDENGNYDFACR